MTPKRGLCATTWVPAPIENREHEERNWLVGEAYQMVLAVLDVEERG